MKLLQTYVALTLLAAANAAPFQGIQPSKRELATAYDYVIVGGGASGLTVANRLSEDSGGLLFFHIPPWVRHQPQTTDMG